MSGSQTDAPQQLFQSIDFGNVPTVVNDSLLPRKIATQLEIECSNDRAFSINDLIGFKPKGTYRVSFKALKPTEVLVGKQIAPRDLRVSELSVLQEADKKACTWSLLAFQTSAHRLIPSSFQEKRRVIALRCFYEIESGMAYPYLFTREDRVFIGLTTLSAFKLRAEDHILYVTSV